MIANFQVQSCKSSLVSIPANIPSMDGLELDTTFLRDLCAWAGMKPSPLAKRAGLTPTTITRPFKGKADSRISQPTFEKLRAAFPEYPRWPTPGVEPDEVATEDYVKVRVLPTYAGAGGGGTGAGAPQTALVSRHLVERELHGAARDFELIDVRGDSMEPVFFHGDRLLVDRRDRDPVQPGPFALFDGDQYLVKLVERIPGRRGWYRVFSANTRYSDQEVEETETMIMGRPVWFARRL